MDDDVLDGVAVVQLPTQEADEQDVAGDLPAELLFELLMC